MYAFFYLLVLILVARTTNIMDFLSSEAVVCVLGHSQVPRDLLYGSRDRMRV